MSFNSAATIRATIDSVLQQTNSNIEHIIIDGGSTDGTVAIVRSYGSKISQFVSEPDQGLYDAMNKGWMRATGEFVAFLNSDDRYASTTVLRHVEQRLKDTGADALYGNLDLVNPSGKVVRRWRSGEFHRGKYHLGWMTPHPTTFARRELFQRYGGFRQDLRIAADYELMLRFFYKQRAHVTYLDETLVAMNAGGASNGSLRAIARANLEVYRSWRLNSCFTTPAVIALKPISKLLQLRL